MDSTRKHAISSKQAEKSRGVAVTTEKKKEEKQTFSVIIINMKKFLPFDWLRAVQFFSKTVQKRVNSVQKEETNQAF